MTRSVLLVTLWGYDDSEDMIEILLTINAPDPSQKNERALARATNAVLSVRTANIVHVRANNVFEAAVNASEELRSRMWGLPWIRNQSTNLEAWICQLPRSAASRESLMFIDVVQTFGEALDNDTTLDESMTDAFTEHAEGLAMSRELESMHHPQTDITRLCAMYVAAARQAEREEAHLYFADDFLMNLLRRLCGLGESEARGWLHGGHNNNEWYIEDSE